MKKLIIFLFSVSLFAQDYGNDAEALELCTTLQSNSFSSDLDADNALDRILSVVGLSKNFVLSPCSDINNAVAVSYKGVRYILYDPQFMSMLSSNTSNWTNLFILAHEVGHHVNGHSLDLVLYAGDIVDAPELEKKRQQELEADEFAGFVLAKLGASLSQTTSSVSKLSNEDDTYSTHPKRDKRIASIRKGWNRGPKKPIIPTNKNKSFKKKYTSNNWSSERKINVVDNPFEKKQKNSLKSSVEGLRQNSSSFSTKPPLIEIIQRGTTGEIHIDANLNILNLNFEFNPYKYEREEKCYNNYGKKYSNEIKQARVWYFEEGLSKYDIFNDIIKGKPKVKMSDGNYSQSFNWKIYISAEFVFDNNIDKKYSARFSLEDFIRLPNGNYIANKASLEINGCYKKNKSKDFRGCLWSDEENGYILDMLMEKNSFQIKFGSAIATNDPIKDFSWRSWRDVGEAILSNKCIVKAICTGENFGEYLDFSLKGSAKALSL